MQVIILFYLSTEFCGVTIPVNPTKYCFNGRYGNKIKGLIIASVNNCLTLTC